MNWLLWVAVASRNTYCDRDDLPGFASPAGGIAACDLWEFRRTCEIRRRRPAAAGVRNSRIESIRTDVLLHTTWSQSRARSPSRFCPVHCELLPSAPAAG